MKTPIVKILLVILLFTIIKNSSAQHDTPYKKQINYLLDEIMLNKKFINFNFKDNDKNVVEVKFIESGPGSWRINIIKDSSTYNHYFYYFDSIYQIGYVKPGKDENICIIVISTTGGNGIITNEFSFINPDFDDYVNIKINYNINRDEINYYYNQTALDAKRLNETKFIVGLLGEYKMIGYDNYKKKIKK